MRRLPTFTNALSLILFVTILCQAASHKSLAQPITFGGFISNGYLKSSDYNYLVDSEEGDFDFVELGLNVSWTPRDRLTVNGQILAFELGTYGNYKPLIDYLFLDYNFRREFGLRLGRVKRDIGIYNNIQGIDAARTSILLPVGTYDQRFRDITANLDGLSLYGTFNLNPDSSIDYVLFSGELDLKPEGGVAGAALTNLSRITVNPLVESVDVGNISGVQLWYNPKLNGLRIGLAASKLEDIVVAATASFPDSTPNPFIAGKRIRSVTDQASYQFLQGAIEYYINEWNFVGEYIHTRNPLRSTSELEGLPLQQINDELVSKAWYASISRRLGAFEAALTYSDYQTSLNDLTGGDSPDSAAYHKAIQISLRYDVTDYWTLKVENHSINGTSQLFNQFGQNPSLNQESWTLWAAKSTFYF